MFRKILIANRGEIAVRIIKTLDRMGIGSVAVYADQDRDALHTRLAGESIPLKGNDLGSTYLNAGKMIEIALRSGAGAIHPGYGFLSENADFASAVAEAGLVFIGPSPGVIRIMGDKSMAAKTVSSLGLPVIEGREGDVSELLEFFRKAGSSVFPLMIKAAAGGGGKGMRKVMNYPELQEALQISSREAMNYFGDPRIRVERLIEDARHVEVQVLADRAGNILLAGERECSVQRRFQKVIEESPSAFLTEKTRRKMFEISRQIAAGTGYLNAGTIEYLVDTEQNFYFLEMNTRIQVEHPVTEMVTGTDIVEQQILIAAGRLLNPGFTVLQPEGHAVEARIYAEDPAEGFTPSPGMIYLNRITSFPGIRIDQGTGQEFMVHPAFDPLVAKVSAHGTDRREAIGNLSLALSDAAVSGSRTNRMFLKAILEDADFVENRLSVNWLEKKAVTIIRRMNEQMNGTPQEEIFALWLTFRLFGHKPDRLPIPWNRVKRLRSLFKKTVVFNDKYIELCVPTINNDHFVFEADGQPYQVDVSLIAGSELQVDLDGKMLSGVVSAGKDIEDMVFIRGMEFRIKPLDFLPSGPFLTDQSSAGRSGKHIIKSPLHGRIVGLNAETGKKVLKGELLFILDAMKIENRIIAPFDGQITDVKVNIGDQVELDQPVLVIE